MPFSKAQASLYFVPGFIGQKLASASVMNQQILFILLIISFLYLKYMIFGNSTISGICYLNWFGSCCIFVILFYFNATLCLRRYRLLNWPTSKRTRS